MARVTGDYCLGVWVPMIGCDVVVPAASFWFKKVRSNMLVVFILSIFVNIGMWFERFVIIVVSLSTPTTFRRMWRQFPPTWVDILTFLGTFGLFFTFFLLGSCVFCPSLPSRK